MPTPEQRSKSENLVYDFVHNTIFSFCVGPFINGMSFSINRKGFMNGVKEVLTSAHGWKCNGLIALVVGVASTGVNWVFQRGRFAQSEPASTGSPSASDAPAAPTTAHHASREAERRAQAETSAAHSRQ